MGTRSTQGIIIDTYTFQLFIISSHQTYDGSVQTKKPPKGSNSNSNTMQRKSTMKSKKEEFTVLNSETLFKLQQQLDRNFELMQKN